MLALGWLMRLLDLFEQLHADDGRVRLVVGTAVHRRQWAPRPLQLAVLGKKQAAMRSSFRGLRFPCPPVPNHGGKSLGATCILYEPS